MTVAAAVACVAAAVLFVSAVGRPPETVLTGSSPAQGSTVTAPVDTVRLTFSTDLAEAHIAVQDQPEQERVAVDGRTVVVPAELTGSGPHRVAYHVRTTAGHDLSGALTFTVDGVGEPAAAAPGGATGHHSMRLDRLTALVLAANVVVMLVLGFRLWATRSRRRA